MSEAINTYRAHSVINNLGDTSVTDLPIGTRLVYLREIVDAAQKAERQLLMQVGCDLAKHMLALGINPTGRPVGETLKTLDEEGNAICLQR
jgi:hypothetical protein